MRHPPRVSTFLVVLLTASGLASCGRSGGAPGPPRPYRSATARSDSPRPDGEPAGLPGATRPGTLPPVIGNGPRSGDRVALTFDADMTDAMLGRLAADPAISYANRAVLDILERTGTPATFFLTGEWIETYPELTRRLAANRDVELANHTYRHAAATANCYHLPQLPAAAFASEVDRTFGILARYGGRQTRYFRFPGGCYDQAALQALAPLGLTVIGWDVVSGDPFAAAPGPIVDAVLSRVRPGSIVVLHITQANAEYTDEALPSILDGLRQRGLRPVTVSELLRGS